MEYLCHGYHTQTGRSYLGSLRVQLGLCEFSTLRDPHQYQSRQWMGRRARLIALVLISTSVKWIDFVSQLGVKIENGCSFIIITHPGDRTSLLHRGSPTFTVGGESCLASQGKERKHISREKEGEMRQKKNNLATIWR